MDTLERRCAKPKAHMNKSKPTEPTATVTAASAPQTKRYDDAFKQAPLAAFRSEQERASLATPRFGRYIRLDVPANGPARRLFAFVSSDLRATACRSGLSSTSNGRSAIWVSSGYSR